MIQEITIDQIFINDKKQDGTPLVNKNGEPYKLAVIKYNGGESASMYIGGKWAADQLQKVQQLQPNTKAKLEIEENGQYKNFKLPTKTGELEARVEILEKAVGALKKAVLGDKAPVKTQAEPVEPVIPETPVKSQVAKDDIKVSDIPF